MNKKRARVTGLVRLAAAVLLLAIILATLSITGVETSQETDRPPAPEPEALHTGTERRTMTDEENRLLYPGNSVAVG